ncbi:uncharacterized protein TRIREDRAFT_110509 [Trichoderma reesei QM6a]|uniref:Predicted protein n=1 Tax=Hypocrea jecorina (strain QM6a) TaxID=431241 RepID=G0RS71_HYPJQ|nr:uncharacterized protein TRIREDRAFT_110509 [Trichoderma reesei QM6a]EGR46101.1 predicted protein [Trichoderma reesei QM6a]
MASGPADEAAAGFGDDISVTSTDDENDPEMNVDRVLAERHVHGESHLLLLWENLHLGDALWEPRENLPETLVAEWEQAKANQRAGLEPRFVVQDWKDAVIQQYDERCVRHNRRNAARARRGLAETLISPTRQDLLEVLSQWADDEEDDGQRWGEAGQADSAAATSGQGLPQNFSENPPSLHEWQPEDGRDQDFPQLLPDNEPSSPAKQPAQGSEQGSHRVPSNIQPSSPIKQPPGRPEQALPEDPSHNESPSPTMQPAGGISGPSAPMAPSVVTISPRRSLAETLFGKPDENPPENPRLDPPTKLKSALKSAETTSRGSVRFLIPPSEASDEVPRRPSLSQRTPAAKAAAHTNVFTGGRTRKGRHTLSEVAADPSTNPRFLNSHLRRTIELQRRDREGTRAPTQRPVGLISLDPYNPQAPSGEQVSAHDATVGDQANPKRRSPTKGVAHWEDEPMELDPSESLFVPEHTPSPSSDVPNPFNNSHDKEEQPYRSRSISKAVQLGSDGLSVITLSFEGLPDEADASWAKQFCSTEPLVLTHTCTRHDFDCQTAPIGQLKIIPLCQGAVFSCTENESVTSLASNLRLGSTGLLSVCEGYCVYIFCAGEFGGQPTQTASDASLRYLLFEPVHSDSLGPLMLSPAPQLRLSNLAKGGDSSASCSKPLSRVFGLKYEQLLPPLAKNAERHNFFIAFPPRAKQEALLLSWWLRDNNGKCDIRTAYTQGHWDSFLKLSHGAVIIHEDALWSIRSFPRLHNLLHGPRTNYTFWMFSRSLTPIRALGSGESPPSPLGDIRLHRVFDPGAAFLVTPSFFISEPENAYTFMKWFWSRFVKSVDPSRPRKLVLCAKVDEWMNDLSVEKILMTHRRPIAIPEEERVAKGISDLAIHCRWKTFRMLQQLVVDAPSEVAGRIIFAPESIDGNDEQSLVNWFGWWSTLHIHQYRRFTVVGSGQQTEQRLSRIVQTPNYKRHLTNDPDWQPPVLTRQPEASIPCPAPRQSREDEALALKSHLNGIFVAAKRDWSPVRVYFHPVGFSSTAVSFRLGDRGDIYQPYDKWLKFFWDTLEFKGTKKSPHNSVAGLFHTFDEDQASTLTIHNVQCSPWAAVLRPANPHIRPWRHSELFIWDIRYSESISKGKEFCSSDLLETQRRLIKFVEDGAWDTLPLKNVWVGAFGTNLAGVSAMDATLNWIANVPGKVRDWIPAPSKELPKRGWTPVFPERPPEDRWEDERGYRRGGEREYRREDERDYRREDERDYRREDERDYRREDERDYRREDERDYRREDERNYRREDERDYRREDERENRREDERENRREDERENRREDERQNRRQDERGDQKGDRKSSLDSAHAETMQGSPPADDGTAPPKAIFHPPRRGVGQAGSSKCWNRLYHEAQQNDPRFEGKEFAFTFRPTMEWYSEQCKEGRGFEHVAVVPWQEVFRTWKIESASQRGG